MIQRIQTLYLFIASLVLALMFLFPVAGYYGEMHTFMFYVQGVKNMVPDAGEIFHSYFTLPILFFMVSIIIIAFTSIFLFKNRIKQLRLIKLNIFLNIILIIGIFIIYSRMIQSAIKVTEVFKTSAFFPVISLIFFVLAYRAVKRDEKLVRSADRLR